MFKRKIIWSTPAKIELLEILEFYIKRNGNANYSRKFYSKIKRLLDLHRTFAFIGKKTNLENVRAIIVDDFMIFYEIDDTKIIVLTIWNSKRNPDEFYLKF